MTTAKKRRAPKAKLEPKRRCAKKPSAVAPRSFGAHVERCAAEDASPDEFGLDVAVNVARAAMLLGDGVNRYFPALRRGHAPDLRVYSAAVAARTKAHEIVRSFHQLPALDDCGDLARDLARTADVLEALAADPPVAGSIYRLTALGSALSRIQTSCLQILGAVPQGGG